MASVYWRWVWPSGDRRGYRQLFDRECFSTIAPRLTLAASDSELCPSCNEPVQYPGNIDVWATWFIPGQDRKEGALRYHVGCFEQVADFYLQGAFRLADHLEGWGEGPLAPASQPQRWGSWDSVDLTPG